MRPKTLAEVAALVVEHQAFNIPLFEFLDEFYLDPSADAFASEPVLLEPRFGDKGRMMDAYLAAVAEDLGQRFQLPVPTWTAKDERTLRRPWFASELASLRAVLIQESPPAFRSRNLFVSENALHRA